MPLFGAHMSIAGGLYKAVEAAATLGMQTVQLFTHSPSQWIVQPVNGGANCSARGVMATSRSGTEWTARSFAADEAAAFRSAIRTAQLQFPTAHDSYLINLAAPDEELYRKSLAAFIVELEHAEALELAYLVMHPGAHTGSGEASGLTRVIAALDEVHSRCAGFRTQVLLETTAGQGTTLGHRFEHLARIRDGVQSPERLGVCLDTCHVFAAGYPIHTAEGYESTLQQFDDIIGLSQLRLFHVNDSVKGLGSRVDRHAGLGLGQIGLETFGRLVNDRRFQNHPMILETPKENGDGEPMDAVNLGILRSLGESRPRRAAHRSRRPE